MSDDLEYLDRIIAERRAKGQAMRAAGLNPYANDWRPDTTLARLRADYAGTRPAEARKGPIVPLDDRSYRVAGRVLAKRGFGKTVFAPIRDATGDLQLYLNVEHCADFARQVEWLDVGDIVGAEGQAFWTQKGELSLLVKKLRILTKALRPLPEKWHGLKDVETRFRQRYLDLVANEEVQGTFVARSKPPTSRRFRYSSGAMRRNRSRSRAWWCVTKGLAAAPPAMGCIMGVSTSTNPLSLRKFRISRRIWLRLTKSSLTSGLATKSK